MRIVFVLILTSFVFCFANGQQYGWRGPEHSGIYKEKGLIKSWPLAGPILLWETTGIGRGQSSATVLQVEKVRYKSDNENVNNVSLRINTNFQKTDIVIYHLQNGTIFVN